MDKITQRYYDKYNQQVEWDKLTHSVHCEIFTAQLSQLLNKFQEQLKESDGMPAPLKGSLTYKSDALITLMAEITALGFTLLKAEIGDVEDKTYKFLEDEVEPE
jgi:hypothetical protein